MSQQTGWTVVRGVYQGGVIEPLEITPHRDGTQVLVLFPEPVKLTENTKVWQRIKQAIAKELPDILSMTDAEKREEFDKLSAMVAERMSYRSVEDFEKAMSGDIYDLTGY